MKRGISLVGLLTIVCLSSVGCSAVCIQNHLDEKLRCDIPNVEGRWSGTDRETDKQSYFEVVRDGVGRYRVIFPETGDFVVATTGDRTSLRFEAYAVGGQLFVEPVATTTASEPLLPFPVLLKADIEGGQMRFAALRPDFLKRNPSVVRHVTIASGAAEPDYLIAAQPDELAAFLVLVKDNATAWQSLDEKFVKQPNPPSFVRRVWEKWSRWFWTLAVFGGAWLVGLASRRVLKSSETPAPTSGLRRSWVDDVARLLVLTVRSTRGEHEQALRDSERKLIAAVVATEAKRGDAPGPSACRRAKSIA